MLFFSIPEDPSARILYKYCTRIHTCSDLSFYVAADYSDHFWNRVTIYIINIITYINVAGRIPPRVIILINYVTNNNNNNNN